MAAIAIGGNEAARGGSDPSELLGLGVGPVVDGNTALAGVGDFALPIGWNSVSIEGRTVESASVGTLATGGGELPWPFVFGKAGGGGGGGDGDVPLFLSMSSRGAGDCFVVLVLESFLGCGFLGAGFLGCGFLGAGFLGCGFLGAGFAV